VKWLHRVVEELIPDIACFIAAKRKKLRKYGQVGGFICVFREVAGAAL
jgi:hypothetical protein